MDVASSEGGEKASATFMEVAKPSLVELDDTDSTELWLIQWPINQALDFDGQEVKLKVHHDGQLGSFEGETGKSYDIVSYECQEPDATVFLSFASEFKAVGKISRRVSLVHYPEPEELVKTGSSRANNLYLKPGSSMTRSSFRSTTLSHGSKSRLLSTPGTTSKRNSRTSSGPAVSEATLGTPKSSRKRTRESIGSQEQSSIDSERSNKTGTSSGSGRHSPSKSAKKMKIEK